MSDDLFAQAEEPQREALKVAGAWPVWTPGSKLWRLPDGSVVVEQEALAWLRRRQAEIK
jgi:hypothetical protein